MSEEMSDHKFPDFLTVFLDNPSSLGTLSQPGLGMFDYRGQDGSWPLTTSLERISEGMDKFRNYEEFSMIEKFKRQFEFYSNAEPQPNKKVEWLAAIQHFGGPTRLLDFTTSIYIGAYFSVYGSGKEPCIWAFNRWSIVRDYSRSIRKANKRCLRTLERSIANEMPKEEDSTLSVLPIETNRINSRLAKQKGLFYAPLSLRHSFEENLCASLEASDFDWKNWDTFDSDDLDEFSRAHPDRFIESMKSVKVMRILIKKGAVRDLKIALNQMNIGALTLFGGLEGLAKHVGETSAVEILRTELESN